MSVQPLALQDSASLFAEVNSLYEPYLAACRKSIVRDLADAPSAARLTEYFERGKMIRPALVFLSAAATGGDPADALPAAEAMELLHGAALIHDDIIDRADERRGLPALHRVVGESAALVLGDYLILRSFDVLARAERATPAGLLSAVRLLSRYAQECCRGQVQELAPSEIRASEQQYFSIVRGKTASQFGAAVTLGAVFSGAAEEEVRALRTFGINAGIAFQIRDDELDLTGDSAVLGKPAGNSLEAGRPLLPLIYLAKRASPEVIAAAAFRNDRSGRREMVRMLAEEGVLERVRRIKQRFLARGLRALEKLRPSVARNALRVVAIYSVYRDH